MTLPPDLARERLEEARIYLLLTRALCVRDPQAVLDEALDAGVGLVQVREPSLSDRELLEWVHDVRERTARFRVPLIVNDRVDIALLAGAEGVHVGQDDLPPHAVRELAGPRFIVGVSTHDLLQVTRAAAEPVDYIGVGPVFDTETKGVPGKGVGLLTEVLPHVAVPAFGVGGMRSDRIAEARRAGLRRIAVSSAICGAHEPGRVVQELLQHLS